jgi:hypothetical protein
MKNTIEQLLSNCSEIDFGTIALSNDQEMFYDHFNRSILLLCESLPDSAQTDALFFFMEYSGLSIGQKLDFFKNYYVPSWSMIYWLGQYLPENQVSEKQDLQNAITAQAMAMILHSLDDHINDQQIPASHLTLLLRSCSWTTMMQALENLIKDLKDGRKIVDDFINNYYSGILESDNNNTLEGYCESFKNQMATWLIVPVLMAKKMTTDNEFTHAIQTAYESFGIAWRLLDDINDVETDLKKGSQSAVYLCLPDDIKKNWGKDSGEKSLHNIDFSEVIYDSILKHNIVYRLLQKICKALESAASLSDRCNMAGLANEYRCLLKPLKDARVLK